MDSGERPLSGHNAAELALALFEEAGDALFLFDPESDQLLDVNPMAQKLSGFTRQKLLSMAVSYWFRSDVQGALHRLRHAYRKTGIFHSQEGFFLRNQQADVWIPVNLTVTRLHVQPRTLGLITARDVREQRDAHSQLKRMEAELRSVLASVSDYLWSAEVDPTGHWRYRYYSPVVEKITGRPPEFYLPGPERWLSTIHPEDRARLEQTLASWKRGQTSPVEEEYRVVWPDGSIRWVRDSIQVRWGPNGRTLNLDGVVTDITDRKQAEEDLRTSEALYHSLGETLPLCIFRKDCEGRFIFANQRLCQELGRSTAEIQGKTDFDFFVPGLAEKYRNDDRRVMETGAVFEDIEQYHLPDGQERYIHVVKTPVHDAHGRLVGIQGAFWDVTERKEMEVALRRSEERFRALVEKSSDAIALVGTQGDILYVSSSSQRILGYDTDDLIGRRGFEFIHPEDRPKVESLFAQSVAQPEREVSVVCRCQHRNGGWRFIEAVGRSRFDDPSVQALVVNYRDVTERRRAEEALRASEERYRLLFERNLAGVYRVTVDGKLLDCNDSCARIFGYSSRIDFLEQSTSTLYFQPADREAFLERLRQRRTLTNYVICMRRRNGSPVWTLENVSLLEIAHGIEIIEGTIIDITERMLVEEALAKERALLRSLIDSVPDLIFYKDHAGTYLGCNKAFEQHVGRFEREIIGLTDLDLFAPDVGRTFQENDRQALAAGRARRNEEWIDYPDGRRVLVEVLKTPFFGPAGEVLGLIGVSRDITERRRLEEQLRQAGKMEAIGQLAGGIAHDFNNLLTAILGNVSLFLAGFPQAHPSRELLEATENAAWRAAQLTSQLLGFSRQSVLQLQPVDLNAATEETVALLRRTIDPRIQLIVRAAPGLWTVQADPSQINQILMNLCLNARDAMSKGGRLILETANLHLDEEYTRLHLESRPGDFVRLRVSDTGQGIPVEIRPRIFEPFFTTKGPGKGTGLGLAMVYGIVKQHQGWVECYSEIGMGTRFDIYLPRVLTHLNNDLSETPPPAFARGCGEVVLLVDDEAMIRNLGRLILQQYGYDVILAEHGLEAVEIYQKEKNRIALVILALTMPELSGQDALRQLLQIDPRVRVLFSSGYSAEHVSEADRERVMGFVNKPYSPTELARSVCAALDGR